MVTLTRQLRVELGFANNSCVWSVKLDCNWTYKTADFVCQSQSSSRTDQNPASSAYGHLLCLWARCCAWQFKTKCVNFKNTSFFQKLSISWQNLDLMLPNRFVAIDTTDYQHQEVSGKNIRWPIEEQYPSCQPFDLFDYFPMDTIVPKKVSFVFNIVDNFGRVDK